MEVPKELIDKFKRQEKIEKERKDKKASSLHYKRRKLDKDVRQYTNNNTRLNSRDIDAIGRHHGFFIG